MSEYMQLFYALSQVGLTALVVYLLPTNEQLALKVLLCQAAIAIATIFWITS
jgi:hypothetical protein